MLNLIFESVKIFFYGLPICAKHNEKHAIYIEGTPASHMLRTVYNPIGGGN